MREDSVTAIRRIHGSDEVNVPVRISRTDLGGVEGYAVLLSDHRKGLERYSWICDSSDGWLRPFSGTSRGPATAAEYRNVLASIQQKRGKGLQSQLGSRVSFAWPNLTLEYDSTDKRIEVDVTQGETDSTVDLMYHVPQRQFLNQLPNLRFPLNSKYIGADTVMNGVHAASPYEWRESAFNIPGVGTYLLGKTGEVIAYIWLAAEGPFPLTEMSYTLNRNRVINLLNSRYGKPTTYAGEPVWIHDSTITQITADSSKLVFGLIIAHKDFQALRNW